MLLLFSSYAPSLQKYGGENNNTQEIFDRYGLWFESSVD